MAGVRGATSKHQPHHDSNSSTAGRSSTATVRALRRPPRVCPCGQQSTHSYIHAAAVVTDAAAAPRTQSCMARARQDGLHTTTSLHTTMHDRVHTHCRSLALSTHQRSLVTLVARSHTRCSHSPAQKRRKLAPGEGCAVRSSCCLRTPPALCHNAGGMRVNAVSSPPATPALAIATHTSWAAQCCRCPRGAEACG